MEEPIDKAIFLSLLKSGLVLWYYVYPFLWSWLLRIALTVYWSRSAHCAELMKRHILGFQILLRRWAWSDWRWQAFVTKMSAMNSNRAVPFLFNGYVLVMCVLATALGPRDVVDKSTGVTADARAILTVAGIQRDHKAIAFIDFCGDRNVERTVGLSTAVNETQAARASFSAFQFPLRRRQSYSRILVWVSFSIPLKQVNGPILESYNWLEHTRHYVPASLSAVGEVPYLCFYIAQCIGMGWWAHDRLRTRLNIVITANPLGS
jgi:hypothetical protein